MTRLQTWVANQLVTPFNFCKETQFLEAHRKKVSSGNTLADILNTSSVILKDLRLELEVRDSDFVQIKSRGHIQSCFLKVMLDRASIVDCIMAQDLSQDSYVVV